MLHAVLRSQVHASEDSKQKQVQCGPEAPAGGTLRAPALGVGWGGGGEQPRQDPMGGIAEPHCVEGGRKAHSNWGAAPT